MDSISKTINALESHENVDRAEIEQSSGDDIVVSAFVDDMTDEFERMVEEDLGLEVKRSKYVVFGHEITLA